MYLFFVFGELGLLCPPLEDDGIQEVSGLLPLICTTKSWKSQVFSLFPGKQYLFTYRCYLSSQLTLTRNIFECVLYRNGFTQQHCPLSISTDDSDFLTTKSFLYILRWIFLGFAKIPYPIFPHGFTLHKCSMNCFLDNEDRKTFLVENHVDWC